MTFLTPLLLGGFAALALPVLIHLVQRERRRVVPFPSLMFLRRIPYQSVRRRRIRDWLLLAVRLAALLLIVLAFARPFFPRGAIAAAAARGGREVVILLDRSASMAYGDHWSRATAAARDVVAHLASGDRATLVLFDAGAEERVRSTGDARRLDEAIAAAHPGAAATRFGPALKLALSVLARSPLPRREAVLISDLQKSGWRGGEDVRFPPAATLTIVPVGSTDARNVSVASVSIARATFAGKERVSLTAAVRNGGSTPVESVPVSLQVGDAVVQTVETGVGAKASAAVAFAPFTLGEPGMTAIVRAGTDPMPADNAFRLVLDPSPTLGVLLVEPEGHDPLYLRSALSIGTSPSFRVDTAPASAVTPADLGRRALVVLDDVEPARVAAGALANYVAHGGGLLMLLGGGGSAAPGAADRRDDPFPSSTTDGREDTAPTTLGYVDYSHPVFEIFQGAHGGDFAGTHVYRYRPLAVGRGDRVLARFSDGGVAALERRIGSGRVIAWTSTLDDSWNDLALRPVFLPFVQQIARYLARYQPLPSWRTVGDAIEPGIADRGAPPDRSSPHDPVVVAPSGREIDRSAFVELDEPGFYEIRTAPVPTRIAVNLDPTESDLATLNADELRAAVTGHAGADGTTAAAALTGEDLERRQSIWWYLLFGGLLLLALDTVLSSRVSAPAPAGATGMPASARRAREPRTPDVESRIFEGRADVAR